MNDRMTVKEFAERVGVTRQNIYYRIRNPKDPFDYPLTEEKAANYQRRPVGRPPRR